MKEMEGSDDRSGVAPPREYKTFSTKISNGIEFVKCTIYKFVSDTIQQGSEKNDTEPFDRFTRRMSRIGANRVENEKIIIGIPNWREMFDLGLHEHRGCMLIHIFNQGLHRSNVLPPYVLYAMGGLLYVCCTV